MMTINTEKNMAEEPTISSEEPVRKARRPRRKAEAPTEISPAEEHPAPAETTKEKPKARRPRKPKAEKAPAPEAEPPVPAVPEKAAETPTPKASHRRRAPAAEAPDAVAPPKRRPSRRKQSVPEVPTEASPESSAIPSGPSDGETPSDDDDSTPDYDGEAETAAVPEDGSDTQISQDSGNRNRQPRQQRNRRSRPGGRREPEIALPENWCARRWVEQLLRFNRNREVLKRWKNGRLYVQRGQVLEIEIGANALLAKVQGSRPKPYQVRMELNKLRREAWGRVLISVAGKAQYTARLLEGEMPPEIERVFAAAGAHLFPANENDFHVKCSCPDKLSPCKHLTAVFCAMAEALERDPFLLFALRGKTRSQFLQDLRDMRFRAQRGSKQPEYSESEKKQIASFWRMGKLNDIITESTGHELSDPAHLIHSLGDPPASIVRAGMAVPVFETTYRQVADAVHRLPKSN